MPLSEANSNVSPSRGGRLDRRPPKTATLAAQRIVREITDRGLAPGDTLPSERQMLAEHGIGRGTLREALRYLEIQGVINIRPGPGGGPFVSAPDPRFLASSIALMLQSTKTPFKSIVDIRAVIEPELAARAATHIDPEHLAQLRETVDGIEASVGNHAAFLIENERFHDIIAASSDNTVFGYLMASLHWIGDGSVVGVRYEEWAQKVVIKAHMRIYDAIEAGDAEKASERMLRHVREFGRFLQDNYPHVMDQIVRWDQVPL